MTIKATEPTITEHEAAQVERANASSATPVVFVHGLWLLPSSWDRWVTLFEGAGYVGLTPGWPDDPETVAEAREHPEVLAGKGIREIADYEEAIIRRLNRKPVIIGHSFGGLLTMLLAVVSFVFLPWLDRSPVRSIRYKGWFSRLALTIFAISFLALGYLGLQPAQGMYVLLARIFAAFYFAFFWLMPLYSKLDPAKVVPERLS